MPSPTTLQSTLSRLGIPRPHKGFPLRGSDRVSLGFATSPVALRPATLRARFEPRVASTLLAIKGKRNC